jgi:hypothetical protein
VEGAHSSDVVEATAARWGAGGGSAWRGAREGSAPAPVRRGGATSRRGRGGAAALGRGLRRARRARRLGGGRPAPGEPPCAAAGGGGWGQGGRPRPRRERGWPGPCPLVADGGVELATKGGAAARAAAVLEASCRGGRRRPPWPARGGSRRSGRGLAARVWPPLGGKDEPPWGGGWS